jgi:hypothetical protein
MIRNLHTSAFAQDVKKLSSTERPSLGAAVLYLRGTPQPWLPDGTFSYQKSRFRSILNSTGTEIFGKIYGHLVYFVVIISPFWLSVP